MYGIGLESHPVISFYAEPSNFITTESLFLNFDSLKYSMTQPLTEMSTKNLPGGKG
jgi:hypothetical protein